LRSVIFCREHVDLENVGTSKGCRQPAAGPQIKFPPYSVEGLSHPSCPLIHVTCDSGHKIVKLFPEWTARDLPGVSLEFTSNRCS
jgi:hypothetical protein